MFGMEMAKATRGKTQPGYLFNSTMVGEFWRRLQGAPNNSNKSAKWHL